MGIDNIIYGLIWTVFKLILLILYSFLQLWSSAKKDFNLTVGQSTDLHFATLGVMHFSFSQFIPL